MNEFHLAQVNIAQMLAPMDDPIMADFVANLDRINALAEKSNGFVWRLKDEEGNAMAVRVFDDEFLIINMSVWENRQTLFDYVYKSMHVEILKRKTEWFSNMKNMHMALWYVPKGHFPTPQEAKDRLSYYNTHGATPYAFGFKHEFTAEEAVAYQPNTTV
ncbi:DUF3291 domain-containing protein [Spongiivirga citrea]|uniref:DUF3291 domain-containing protein n=1 Tax=Spongiivirga citrea TaxID=1481457 RepID=A0A6M0CL12_9FLAO|nr:DUF3291 domain-containing protein [Spongiivirga citrea]NER17663.1 DUF3291 domain-containing protein [Spongiivirga citrea]